jgi:hypothetical protein
MFPFLHDFHPSLADIRNTSTTFQFHISEEAAAAALAATASSFAVINIFQLHSRQTHLQQRLIIKECRQCRKTYEYFETFYLQ